MARNWQAEIFKEKYNFKRPANEWLKAWYGAKYKFLTVKVEDETPEPEME